MPGVREALRRIEEALDTSRLGRQSFENELDVVVVYLDCRIVVTMTIVCMVAVDWDRLGLLRIRTIHAKVKRE